VIGERRPPWERLLAGAQFNGSAETSGTPVFPSGFVGAKRAQLRHGLNQIESAAVVSLANSSLDNVVAALRPHARNVKFVPRNEMMLILPNGLVESR